MFAFFGKKSRIPNMKNMQFDTYPYGIYRYNDFMLVFLEGAPAADNITTVKLNSSNPLVLSMAKGRQSSKEMWSSRNCEMFSLLMN